MLVPELRFSLGISFVELDYIYRGLWEFQKVRNDPNASSYRRSLAALNEAWILWDLGQVHAVERLINQVPPGFAARIQLCRELISGETSLARKWICHGLPADLAPAEKPRVLMHLAEFIAIFDFPPTPTYLSQLEYAYRKSEGSQKRLFQLAYRIVGSLEPTPEGPSAHLSWREACESFQLQALLAAKMGQNPTEIYYRDLLPLLEDRHLLNPLFPVLRNGVLINKNPWTQSIVSKFFLRSADSKPLLNSRAFILRDQTLFCDGQVVLHLKAHPVSLKLLKLLGGPGDQKVSKRWIHEQLTASKYVTHLHDNRLLKLLKRLEEKIKSSGFDSPWILQRDNFVHLISKIEVME